MAVKVGNTPAYRWVVLLLATLIQGSVSMLQQAPSALGPLLARDLDLTRTQLGLLSSAIIGGMTLTTLLMGLLIDRRGERMVVSVGVAAMALLVLLATQAQAFWWLFTLLLLASFGASSSTPGGSKAIRAWFARAQRGLAMGIRQTGIPVGGLLAALLLPPLAVEVGWAAALGFCTVGVLLVVVLFAVFFREPRAEEHVVSQPRVPLRSILKDRVFLAATGYSFVLVGAQWSATAYLTLFLNEEAGIPVVVAGSILAVLQVGGIAGRIGWGAVSDRVGRRVPIMVLAGALAVPCCLILGLLGGQASPQVLVLLAGILGLSVVGWNGLYIAIVSESAPERAAATAVGAGLTFTNLGSFVTPPVFGLLLDLSDSYSAFWLALAGWVAFGAVLGCFAREPDRTG